MPLINHCNGGSSFAAVIQVTYNSGAVCTCTNGSTTLTAPDTSGSAEFIVKKKGTWTITVTLGSKTKSGTVSITADGQIESLEVFVAKIYGISRDITKSSPAWARTDDAIELTATASTNSVAGVSDFDNCAPWSGIEREIFKTTKDVMVKIPRFWYQRYRSGNVEYIKIADREVDGFDLHPAFNHANTPKDCIYVGAYMSSGGASLSGKIITNRYRNVQRDQATAKGAGWGLLDISTLSAIQMLILVEFATNDVQNVIGYGYCGSHSDTESTGYCDNVANLTGVNSSGRVIWRGIEDIWGNASHEIDGLWRSGSDYYVSNDPSKYNDKSLHTKLSYSMYLNDYTNTYITQLGLDPNYPYIMLPTAASNGSASTYMCDTVSVITYTTTNYYCIHGGAYDDSDHAGLFFIDGTIEENYNASYGQGRQGSRLIYIPQEAAS